MRRPQAFRYLSNGDEREALRTVHIQIRSHAYDGSPAAYGGGAAPAPPASARRCPGETRGEGVGISSRRHPRA
jgi:hypothetical protein